MTRRPVVLVTGASSGIGAATASLFAAKGASVIGTASTPASATDAHHRFLDAHFDVEMRAMSVANRTEVSEVMRSVAREWGRVDILVSNAGHQLLGAVEAVTDDEACYQFEVNVFGHLRVLREVLPMMRAARSGTVVVVGSITGRAVRAYAGLYSASKAAVASMTEALRFELAPFGIRVLLIEPGTTASSLRDRAVHATGPAAGDYAPHHKTFDERLEQLRSAPPILPRRVAETIVGAAMGSSDHFDHPCGEDAKALTELRGNGFDTYERTLRELLSWPPA